MEARLSWKGHTPRCPVNPASHHGALSCGFCPKSQLCCRPGLLGEGPAAIEGFPPADSPSLSTRGQPHLQALPLRRDGIQGQGHSASPASGIEDSAPGIQQVLNP